MSLRLADMDNFTLAEIDNIALHELDNMSYQDLVNTVIAKYRLTVKTCNPSKTLSDAQRSAVQEIIHTYIKENTPTLTKSITISVAIDAIGQFLFFVINKVAEHSQEVIDSLKQAYILLLQLIE